MLRALPLREGQACCALSCGPHLVCSAHEGVADDHVEQRGGAETAGGGFPGHGGKQCRVDAHTEPSGAGGAGSAKGLGIAAPEPST